MANIKVQSIFAKIKPKQTQQYAKIILKIEIKERFIRKKLFKMITNVWNAYGLTVLGDKKQETLRLLKLGNVIIFQMSISQYIFQALRRKKQTRGRQP